ncbi:hypothetical protein [Bacillus cereus]|uniref:hypothetical protein n=1 Tax=Bacillus cereus TaxID=1396 RepID=UPI003CF6CA5A
MKKTVVHYVTIDLSRKEDMEEYAKELPKYEEGGFRIEKSHREGLELCMRFTKETN